MMIRMSESNLALDTGRLGNKAKNLIFMKQNGFCVPDGFVLDSDVFDKVIQNTGLADKIHAILGKLPADAGTDKIQAVSKKLQSLLEGISFPDAIASEIRKNVIDGMKYAVRSSGTQEDLANLAFAGQYETFLNVSGAEDICKAVINCYRSMFSEKVLSYLIRNSLDVGNLKMAVVVQEMVDSEVSGIIFTINPVSGNDKEIVIEAAAGLGENIVSGKVKPERYAYDWFHDRRKVEAGNTLLDEVLFNKITETALKIQVLFGFPCDIEFAVYRRELYILQARAITKIMYGEIKDQWTTADFKDGGVSATVCTPYMWSLYEYIWEKTFHKFVTTSKMIKEKEWRKSGNMYYGRPYWNLSIAKKAMSRVPGYKEREFDSEFGVKITYEGDGKVTKINPKTIFDIVRMALAQKEIVAQRRENASRLKEELLEKYKVYENNELGRYTKEEFEPIWYNLVKNDYLKSEGTYFWQIFINTVHQSLYKDKLLKYVRESEYFNLIGGLDQVSHLRPFYEMWDITREINQDPDAFSFWAKSEMEDLVEVYAQSDEYCMPQVREYIRAYGYHSEKELDVTYPCYVEDIARVLQMFKNTVILGEEYSPNLDRESQTEKYKKQMDEIRRKVSASKYAKLEGIVGQMRKMLWWREEFRDISTRFYYIIRVYTMRLAELYAEEGVISNADEIWYTKIEDLFGYIEKKVTGEELRRIIIRNQKYYNSFRHFMSENEIGSVYDQEAVGMGASSGIHGIGCNNGTVTGTARVIESLAEIERLQPGDILVTRFTDTGWTSKFAILKGIVTEYGGILCHAAIVSREYGIPCVVCAHDATTKIKDGSTITINGSTGEIQIEKE